MGKTPMKQVHVCHLTERNYIFHLTERAGMESTIFGKAVGTTKKWNGVNQPIWDQ